MRPCIFEYIYFARPDSVVHGRSVYDVRKAHGRAARAERRRPTPTSSCRCRIPACRRRSATPRRRGMPFELGIIRNHYVGRTFIQPTQAIRELGVRMKHNANRAVVAGKRVVLIDDSIVRGTTSRQDRADDARRRARARCICASPRRRSPIPISTASTRPSATSCSPRRMDLEEMRRLHRRRQPRLPLGRRHLPRDGLSRPRPARPQFTDHCFTGDYPTRLTDQVGESEKRQMSLLAEAS